MNLTLQSVRPLNFDLNPVGVKGFGTLVGPTGIKFGDPSKNFLSDVFGSGSGSTGFTLNPLGGGLGSLLGNDLVGGLLSGIRSLEGQSDITAWTKHLTTFDNYIKGLNSDYANNPSTLLTMTSKAIAYAKLFAVAHHNPTKSRPDRNAYKGTKIVLDGILTFEKKFHTFLSDFSKNHKVSYSNEQMTFPNGYISTMVYSGSNRTAPYRKYVVSAKSIDPKATVKKGSSDDNPNKKTWKNYIGFIIGLPILILGGLYLIFKKK